MHCRTSRPKLQPDDVVAAHEMGRSQATLVDAPAPDRVHLLPSPRQASRRRPAGRPDRVAIAARRVRVRRQILGEAGRNVRRALGLEQPVCLEMEKHGPEGVAGRAVLVVVRPLSAQPETSLRVECFRARDRAGIHARDVGRPVARLATSLGRASRRATVLLPCDPSEGRTATATHARCTPGSTA